MRLLLLLLISLLCIDMIIGIGGTAITNSKTPSGETPSGYDPDAQAYITAVETADGEALETGVKDAINAFVVGCKDDGIWTAIKSAAIMAGARTLAGALQPLKGTAPTNFNFVSSDYNRRTGLLGDGTTKYLSSNRANNADPQDNNHNAFYVTAAPTSGLRFFMASDPGPTTGSNNFLQNTDNRLYVRNRSATYQNTLASAFTLGFKGFSRTNSVDYTLRDDGASSVITRVSETPSSSVIHIFDRGTTPPHSPTDARLSFYSIGESLDLALLDTRVSNLMTAIDSQVSFSPSDIAGLQLWLKSDAGVLDATDTPITVDNTQIKTWQDQSGNGLDAVQANGALQPVWRDAANGINGKPAVYFAGDIMATANLTAGVYTIFAVHKATVNGLIYERGVSVNTNDGEYLYTTVGYTIAVRRTDGTAKISAWDHTPNWGVGGNTLTTCHQFDGTHAGHTLRVNGSTLSLTSKGALDPGTVDATAALYIGARSGTVAPITGFIAEIVYYDSVLSLADVLKVESYLIDKWGT